MLKIKLYLPTIAPTIFYPMSQPRRKCQPFPGPSVQVRIESMASDGRGVAHLDGKVVFIEGALPGEVVIFSYLNRRKDFDEGRITQILHASPDRVSPKCPHFGVCGGCSLQHMSAAAQIESKQQVLLDNLHRIGKLRPELLLPAITGPHWGYRRKARLGAKYVCKKERVLVGFREKKSPLVADLNCCEVLHPRIGTLLPALRELVASLAIFNQVPQIEVAVGDEDAALIFRHLAALNVQDKERLCAFGRQHGVQIYAQAAGPDSIALLWPERSASLSYRLSDHDLELLFLPTDFTQVNADINRRMVNRVIELLDPKPHEQVLDLFCGLGNFTLALARRCAGITGVEGETGLVQRAYDNARHNGIANAEFHTFDLNETPADAAWMRRTYDKILLDPPRTGALEIIKKFPTLGASRIVYVSCHPATLARDAIELTHIQGYRLVSAGVMDMFPHTLHVESVALFERNC